MNIFKGTQKRGEHGKKVLNFVYNTTNSLVLISKIYRRKTEGKLKAASGKREEIFGCKIES
jgi:hypothetical protein